MSLSVHFIVPVVLLNLVIITAQPQHLQNTDACTNNKTISEAIIEKCSFVADDNQFMSQTFFSNCSKWCEINSTKTLTRSNENDVLCLLYYDAFVPFCKKIIRNGIKNVPLVPNVNYTIETLCSKLEILPNDKVHNLKQMIKSPVICEKLCINYDGTVLTQCNLAYYFSNSNLNSLSNSTLSIQTMKNGFNSETPLYSSSNSKLSIETSKNGFNSDTPYRVNVKPSSNGVSAKSNAEVNAKQNPDVPQNIAKEKDHSSVEKPLENTAKIPLSHNEISNNISSPKVKNETLYKLITTNAFIQPTNVEIIRNTSNLGPIKNVSHANPGTIESVPKSVGESPEKAIDLETDIDGKDEDVVNENEDIRYGQNSPEQDPADNEAYEEEAKASVPNEKKKEKPVTVDDEPANYNTEVLDGESYFFSYFMAVCVLFVLGYVVYHNRTKVFALVLEGKRGKRQFRGRRPNSANYHKLDSNLEEAISSSCTKNSSHVIY